MTFNILRIAALAALGWALVKTYGFIVDQLEEGFGTGGAAPDAESESTPASTEPAAKASAEPKASPAAKASAEPKAAPAAKASGEPKAAPATASQDLRKIQGIGPAIAKLLNARGIDTWTQLAETEVADLQAILAEAGPRYRVHDPSTWPDQAAELAQAN